MKFVIGYSLFVYRKIHLYSLTKNEKRISKSLGFTLIEILFSVAILALLSAVAIPNLRNLSRQQEIDSVGLDVVNTLRTAQSSATSRIQCPNGDSSSNWTVRLGSSNYSLIANCETGAQTLYTKNYVPSSTAATTYSGALDVCSSPPVDVVFLGSQVYYLCSGSSTLQSGMVNLTLTGSSGGTTKVIRIEQGGIIR